MTSQKKWPLVITLLFILSLLLVACERPLPDDGSADVPVEEAPAPGSYPGPIGEEPAGSTQPEDGGSGYPAPDAGPVQPAEEAPPAEAYPPAEGEESANETGEGEASGETIEGETSEEPAAESTEETAIEGEAGQESAAEEGQSTESTEPGESGGERTHTVAAGENLYQIGLQYGISWVAIAQANGIVNPDNLSVGQELIIPDLSETGEDEPADEVGEEDTTGSGEAAETTEEQAILPGDEGEAEEDSPQTTYIVQSGDNLYRISLMYGVNMMDVARANDLANFDDLSIGQELIIPGVEEGDTAGTEADTEVESAEETVTEPPSAEEISHQVAEGETVFGVAFQYGIAWTRLVERNNLTSPYTLEPGQMLVIPVEE